MAPQRESVQAPAAPAAAGPYAHAVRVGGLLFCSGQLPIDPSTGELVKEDPAGQARRCLENLDAVCRAGGTSLASALRVTLYLADGVHNTVLEPDELLVEVRVPARAASLRQAFHKLRTRAAIDFPALNLAVALEVEDGTVRSLRLCVGALAARPALVAGLDDLVGRPADRRLADELGRRAYKQCRPLTNIGVDPGWRREVLPVLVRRTVLRALER